MIYSQNRIAAIGEVEIAVDVNESYFGAGSLFFAQECAEDELALFEAAITSDIEEFHINEAGKDIKEAVGNFAEKAKTTIERLMKQFMEMMRSFAQGAIAKFNQWMVKDNKKFCAKAKKHMANVKDDFTYSGKALKLDKMSELSDQVDALYVVVDELEKMGQNIIAAGSAPENYDEKIKELISKHTLNASKFNEEYVETVENAGKNVVEGHLKLIDGEGFAMKACFELKKKCVEFEGKARKLIKDSKKLGKNKDEAEKAKANAMCDVARAIKQQGFAAIRDGLNAIKQTVKIARAVVTKAVGSAVVSEGAEFDAEFVDAMIETTNFELDELLEEMSEGAECEPDEISEDDEE